MKTPLALVLLFALALIPASLTAKPKNTNSGGHKISEVSASSITLTIGAAGDQHETYKITKDTKVSINGAAADPMDLRAGMQANVKTGSDKATATAINATGPQAASQSAPGRMTRSENHRGKKKLEDQEK